MHDNHDNPYDDFEEENFGYSGNNWHTRSNPRGSMNWPGYQRKILGWLHVTDEAGVVVCTKEVDDYYDKEWKLLIRHYGEPTPEGVIFLPKAAIKQFDTFDPPFLGCSYDASKDLLQNRFGITLHSTDRDWLAFHPFAEENGVSEVNLPTALHQLVEPYGLGVARIRYRRGIFLGGDEQQNWINALGCNPLSLISHAVSNAEAAVQLGMPFEEVNERFRVDFGDTPLTQSVVGAAGDRTSITGGLSSSFGHASFLAKRAKFGPAGWTISLQFDHLDRINYLVPPVLPEYKPRVPAIRFYMKDILRPDGKDLDHEYWKSWKNDDAERDKENKKAVEEAARQAKADKKHLKAVKNPSLFIPGTQRMHREPFSSHGVTMDRVLCVICNEWHWLENVEANTDACRSCYEKAWHGLRCPHSNCRVLLSNVKAPLFLGMDSQGLPVLRCATCFGKLYPSPDRADLKKMFSPAAKPRKVEMMHDTVPGGGTPEVQKMLQTIDEE